MKKRMVCTAMMFMLTLLLAGCGEKEPEKPAMFSGNLTEEEMDTEHLNVQLLDKIVVDADITAYHRYQEGLASYYVTGGANGMEWDNTRENPMAWGRTVPELVELLEAQLGGKFYPEEIDGFFQEDMVEFFQDEEMVVPICEFWFPYDRAPSDHSDTASDDVGKVYFKETHLSDLIMENSISVGFAADSSPSISQENLCQHMQWIQKLYGLDYETELPFASEQEAAQEIKMLLEELTGISICESYDVFPVSSANYTTYAESLEGLTTTVADDYSNDFYGFWFYQQIDGFPWKNFELRIYNKEGIKDYDLEHVLINNFSSIGADGARLPLTEFVTYGPGNIFASYGENGIQNVSANFQFKLAEMYQPKQRVVDLNEVLTEVSAYLGAEIAAFDITIDRVELCYGSSFSKAEDGELRNTAAPFWVVDYWSKQERERMAFDAYTGERIEVYQYHYH